MAKNRKLKKVRTGVFTNAIDGVVVSSGIVGKNPRVRNYEIPDKIFQRELAEYRAEQTALLAQQAAERQRNL